ncbi:MAG: Uma2 family endonuclease [Deltaproteobacteria bacterium]|nr:Uma2 family endonuclease [Deltaproteobacteria bacterium]
MRSVSGGVRVLQGWYSAAVSEPAPALDPRFPNLRPEVVQSYLDAPEHLVAEVLDGELFTMPRPRTLHANAAGAVLVVLDPPFRRARGGPGGWVLLPEPELHLGPRPDIVDPDLAGWRRERMPALPDEAALTLAPDWVCEVLSERTEATDRGKKMRIYRREKVSYVWLVSPTLKTLEVYKLENERYTLLDTYEGNDPVRAEPFDAVDLDLGAFWEL